MADYVRVNEFKIWAPNIQYAIFFQQKSILFLTIGGQLADYPELSNKNWLLSFGLGIIPLFPALILGIIFYLLFPNISASVIFGALIVLLIDILFFSKFKRKIIDNQIKKTAKKNSENINKIIETGTVFDSRISHMSEHNFEIPYDAIVNFKMHPTISSWWRGRRIGHLSICTQKNYEFDIAPNQEYAECRQILESGLRNKVDTNNVCIE